MKLAKIGNFMTQFRKVFVYLSKLKTNTLKKMNKFYGPENWRQAAHI